MSGLDRRAEGEQSGRAEGEQSGRAEGEQYQGIFTAPEVAAATGGRLAAGRAETAFTGVSTDSRRIDPGELFVALRGPRFDGHRFLPEAFRRGARGALVADAAGKTPEGEEVLIVVSDTLRGLQDLAAWHRRRFVIPVVAITGSNGKTTTKEMTAAVLARGFSVHRTEGNLNNQIGLPLVLLGLRAGHTAAVVEMGISEKGELARLAAIATPTIGVITNVAPAHLAGLGTIRDVAIAKGELFEAITSGSVVLNADDPYAPLLASRIQRGVCVVRFGIEGPAEVTATDIRPRADGTDFTLGCDQETARVSIRAWGAHNVQNALAAAAVGHILGIYLKEIARGLEAFRSVPMRDELVRLPGGAVLINDAYNANPASMRAALSSLAERPARCRIAILGEMRELGPEADRLHLEVGAFAAGAGLGRLLLVGDLARRIGEGARATGMDAAAIESFDNPEAAGRALRGALGEGDVVLIKGSRAMGMERAVAELLPGAGS